MGTLVNRRKRLAVAAAALGLTFAGGMVSASAATPNATDCRKVAGIPASASPGSVSSGQLFKYDECRFDKQDAAIAALGSTTPDPSPTPSDAPSETPSPSPTPTPTRTPTPTPSTTPTTQPASACTKPVVTFNGEGSAGLDQYGFPRYDASAELWGVNGYNYAQTMKVCSNDLWSVDVKTDNTKGDGAVKAYPSMRRIYHDWSTQDFSKDPLVSSFPQLKVDFAATEPASCSGCIYDTAFDIWLNGIGNGAANELMVWTYNVGQRPFGSKVASNVSVGGKSWDLWTGNSNHYIAYVPTGGNIPSGTLDVKAFTSDLMARGIIKSDSRLGQISYGVETVSTNAVTKHWDFTKFTITDS